MADVPAPVRGGTWIYCRTRWEDPADGGITMHNCLARFRKLAKYRRHWRRFHQEAASGG